MNGSKGKERRIHGYKSSDKILLVGEGDFSFSACLARAFQTAENIVATTYLKRKSLLKEHWTSISHLDELENLGCKLLYKIDVYKMGTQSALKNLKFDIIIYNFPHAGHYDYLRERDLELIEMHKELVGAYFKSASKMLTEGGEVHLRHREDPPYDSWNVVLLAGEAGLTLKEKVDFNKSDYLGYHNKRGGGINSNESFPIKCAYTYKFTNDLPKKDEVYVLEMNTHVPDNQIEILCGKDTDYDPVAVNVSKLKEEDDVISKLQKDEVSDLLEKDEANDDLFVRKNDEVRLLKNGRTGDLPNSDIDLHVPEMVDVCQQSKSDKVGDDLLKNDDQVPFDFELLKVTDHGDLLKNKKVNADLDLLMVVDRQMNIEIQKLKDELGDDHDIPMEDDQDLPMKYEVVDDGYLPQNDDGVDNNLVEVEG